MSDPKRWLDDDAELLPHERKLLLSGLQVDPSPEQEDKTWELLGGLAPIALEGHANPVDGLDTVSPPSAASPAGISGTMKILLIGLVVPVVAVGAYMTSSSRLSPSGLAGSSPAVQSVAPPETSAVVGQAESPREPVVASVEGRLTQPQQLGVARPHPVTGVGGVLGSAAPIDSTPRALVASPKTEAPATVGASTLKEEALVVDGARSALRRGDTALAAQLLNEANERFPNGVLRQERESLAIELLIRAGREGEAKERAKGFVESHPDSPHSQRLRELLSLP